MKVSSFVDRGRVFDKFLIAILIYMIGGFPTLVYALPQGGTISSGAGTIDTSGSALTVTQTTNKIIINWESFSIGNNESVIFLQPDSSSSALNNVLGTSRTVVEGNLLANGQIVLSNPNGIFLSPNANIDVAGLIASTLKISEQDFLNGLYKFSQDSSKPLASILNEGKIRASDFAALIAPSVDNKGVVIANLGTVGLVSGKAATVDFVGDNLIKFTVNAPVEGQVLDKNGNLISDRISNSGSIQANGGQVILSAKNASSIIQDVINVEGLITAKTVTKKNGLIVISGGNQGNVNVAGTLDASGEKPGDQGGNITVAGASVTVAEGSIQAKGTDAKGGNITITGTDWVNAGGTMDVSGETGGNVNITTGGLYVTAPVLAKGTTGQGGTININTLFKSWELVSAMLDVSGASGGTIKHFANQQITTSGKYIAIGTDGIGGSIDVTANTLKFLSNTIDASGTMGGGRIRLGGEYQGGKNLAVDEIPNARTLVMTDAANITAKTTGTDGDGGRIIVWGDQEAVVLGQFDVTPGTQSGAGGFVEVSSGDNLTFGGNARTGIDERHGTLLLDPKNITIADTTVFDASSFMIGENYSGTNDIDETLLTGDNMGQGTYGTAVSLDGQWLAVGANYGDGLGLNATYNRSGSVFLYSYTDTAFSGGTLQAAIGAGFTGGHNLDLSAKLDVKDQFGYSVSVYKGRLAVGARKDDGRGTASDTHAYGAVYLFSFNDDVSSFSGITHEGTIGKQYADKILIVVGDSNALTVGETIEGLTSGATGVVVLGAANSTSVTYKNPSGTFAAGEIIRGGASTNTRTVSAVTIEGTTTLIGKDIDLSGVYSTTRNTTADSASKGGVDLASNEELGQSVSLSEDRNGNTRLAVGLRYGHGFNESNGSEGEVLLFTFDDGATGKDFDDPELAAVIGESYDNDYSGNANPRGGKDVNIALDNNDSFGSSLSLYYDSDLQAHRLAVTALSDDGDGNGDPEGANGAVYLYRFSDDNFSGGTLQATIGEDYSGGRNIDLDVTETSSFAAVAIDDNYLALGSYKGDGNNASAAEGEVFIYSYTNASIATSFTDLTLEGKLGEGFSGAQDVSVVPESGQTLNSADNFGIGLDMHNNRLAVGADKANGASNSGGGFGEIHIFPISHYEVADGSAFQTANASTNSVNNATYATDITIWPSTIVGLLENSTAVTLQANQDITVTDAINVTSGGATLTLQAGRSIDINANITTNNGALTLSANDTSALNTGITAGTATIDTTGATITTGSGALTATVARSGGHHTSGNIILASTATTGAVTLTTTGNVTIDNGATALNIAASSVGGSFSITNMANVTIVNDNGIKFAASTIGGVLTTNDTNALTVGETITTNSISGVVILGANGSNSVTYTGTARHQTSGAIFAAGGTITGGTSGNTRVISASGVANGTLTATATTGNITQSGALKITGTSSFTTSQPGADITLQDTSNNFFEGVSFNTTADIGTTTGGNVAVKDATDFYLGASTINGNLEVESGDVTKAVIGDDGIVTVTGTTDLSASGTNNNSISSIWMDDFSHVFSDAISAQGHHVNMKFGGATELGTIRAKAGNIVIASSGALTQSGPMQARNDTTITASGQDITLNNTSNSFGGNYDATITSTDVLVGDEIILTGANVEVASDHSFNVGTSTVTGNLTLTSGSAENGAGTYGIIDTGDVSVGANFSATTTANNGAIDMLDLEVDGTIGLNTHGTGNATIENDAHLQFAGSTVGGNLTATATLGNITQGSGALTVTGTSTFITKDNGSNIVLNSALNAFSSWVKMLADTGGNETFGNIEFVDRGAVTIQTTADTDADGELLIDGGTDGAVGGTLSITSTEGDITQGQVLVVTGASTFVVGTTEKNIVLNQSNNFSNSVTMKAGTTGNETFGNITFVDSADVKFHSSAGTNGDLYINAATDGAVGGTLNVTATTGNITQGRALRVTGTTTLETSDDEADITLSDTSNNFASAVTITTNGTTGHATISAGSDARLIFAASTIDGNLIVTSSNATGITQAGALTVLGASSFTTSANNATIILDTTTNTFTGALTITTNDDVGADAHATIDGGTTKLIIAASTIDGDLTIRTGNAADTSGITDAPGEIVTVGGNLSVTNDVDDGDIDMGTLAVTGSIALNTQASGGNAAVTNATALKLAASTVGGTLGVTATTGNITQIGALDIEGTTTLVTLGVGADIDLAANGTGNAFTSELLITTNETSSNKDADVSIDGGITNLIIGNSTIDGNLSLLSGETITDTNGSTVTVKGTLSATTDQPNKIITLDDLAVTGAFTLVTLGTGAATIDNGTANIDIAAASVGGALTLTSGALTSGSNYAIMDSGTVTVGGNLVATTNANSGVINMGSLEVTGSFDLTTHGTGAATVVNGTVLDFLTSGIGGALTAKATTGNITDSNSQVLTVGGNASFQTGTDNADIILDVGHAITGKVTLNTTGSGSDATLDNGTLNIELGDGISVSGATLATSVGGNLTLISGAAAGITDALGEIVTVGGRFYATTDLNNGVINMGTLNILDGGTIKLDTHGNGDATVVNTCTTCSVGLAFETSTIRGDLIAKADSGNIENVLGNTLTVSLTSSFQTGGSGADITLNQTNALSREVTLNTTGSGGDVTLNNGTTALQLGTSAASLATSVSGNLDITVGAAVTDLDGLTVAGTTSITADNAGTKQNVTLEHTSNDFTGAVSVIGAAVQLVDANAIDLGTTTTTGTYQVTATAGGDITDSGTLTIGTTASPQTATFTAAGGQNIYLDNKDSSNVLFGIHTFSDAVSFVSSGGGGDPLVNVTVRDSNAFDFGAALTLAAGGNLILTAGGNVTQTGGALTVPGTTTVSAAGNTVTLSNSSNNFTGAVSIEAHTVDLEDNNVDGLILGASTVTGDYAVEAGNVITQIAALVITGVTTLEAGAGNNITLDNVSNNFLNAVKITSGDNVTLVDADTIDLGASTVSGTYAVTAKLGNITQSGNLTVTNASTFETEVTNGNGTILCGNSLCTLPGGTNAFSGTVKLTTTGSSAHAYIDNGTTALQIADDTSVGGNLTLVSGHDNSGSLKAITDVGSLTVGGNLYATTDANNGDIDLGGLDMSATTSEIQLTTHNTGAATVVNTKHLHFISVDVGGNFIATATDGTITQDNAFDIDGTSDFYSVSADNIILDSAANDFTGDVRFRGGAVVIKDTNDIEFGGGDSTAARTLADASGNQYALKVYAGDRITDDNTIPSNLKITGGNAWFGTNNNDSNRIVLDSASNVFSGTLTMVGGIGHIVNSSAAVVLTAMTLAGDLKVTTTGGTVTDTGVLSVEGLTVISASGFDVTLDGDGTTYNNFQDEVQIVGANVVIKDTNAIKLGKSTVTGTYEVTAGGTVTQNTLSANPLAITGVSTISGTDITLNNTANNFGTAIGVTTIGSDVVLVDTGAIVLGASTVSGTYTVTAGGAVTQANSTVLDIEGVTTIEAGGHVVTLTNANDFTSAVGVTGTTVQVTDTNDLDLGTTTTTGAYTVIAGGGITDSGALTIGTTASAQTASFTAGDGKAIILDHVSASSQPVHDFSGALTFAASSGNLAGLTVYAVDAIALAALTLVAAGGGDLAGNLSLKSGTVTQAGAWVVPGTTTVSSSGSDVTLSRTSNDFGGAVSVTGVNVMLVDANAIDLGASTVTGNYAVTATAGGDITDSGILNVTGTSTFTAAGGQSILLDKSSTFTSAVTFASGGTLVGVSITDSTDFDLQTLALTGNLVVASGGSITQSGNLTIGGTSSFTTSSTNETITLSDTSLTNAFTGAFTLSSTGPNAHVTIDNGTTAIDIASASVGGNLTLTSGAAAGIIDSGPVTVAGNLIAITDANNGIINMVKLAVDGSISLTTHGTGNATIVNDAGLDFASVTIGGDLTATATTLNIIDSGRIKVTGATIITLGTNPVLSVSGATSATDVNGLKITLDTANNLFTGGITLRYDNVAPPDDNSDIYLASQVAFAELLFAIDQNITKIYGSYGEMQDYLLWMYKLFRDSFPRQEQFLEVDRQPQPNQVKLRKIKTNTKKNNASEGKRL